MSAIADVAARMCSDPKPVLCLDTCDILNAMQGLVEKNARQLEWTSRLLTAMALPASPVQPIISFLVLHEWQQNLPQVRMQVERFLNDVDQSLRQVYDAFRHNGMAPPPSVPSTPPSYASTLLVQHFLDRMQAVLDHSCVLDRDQDCTEQALQRVMDKRRPSHKGKIKDSINLEHYLELVRQLRTMGFRDRCLFVSANKDDYWDTPRNTLNVHPELAPEFGAPVQLDFYASPIAALGSLGL